MKNDPLLRPLTEDGAVSRMFLSIWTSLNARLSLVAPVDGFSSLCSHVHGGASKPATFLRLIADPVRSIRARTSTRSNLSGPTTRRRWDGKKSCPYLNLISPCLRKGECSSIFICVLTASGTDRRSRKGTTVDEAGVGCYGVAAHHLRSVRGVVRREWARSDNR